MRLSTRWFLVAVVLLLPGYLALPVAAETEPETLSVWTGDLAAEKLGGFPIRREQLAGVANIYRAASAVRQHLEN